MRKQITSMVYIRLGNQEYQNINDLDSETRKKAIIELNDRALRAVGYVPENEKQKM